MVLEGNVERKHGVFVRSGDVVGCGWGLRGDLGGWGAVLIGVFGGGVFGGGDCGLCYRLCFCASILRRLGGSPGLHRSSGGAVSGLGLVRASCVHSVRSSDWCMGTCVYAGVDMCSGAISWAGLYPGRGYSLGVLGL